MTSDVNPEAKTPISVLQELCTRWGIIPKYELSAHEGPIHDPVFEYRVVAGEYSATGKGSSKKKAKHRAAESLISLIKSTQNGSSYSVIASDGLGNPRCHADDVSCCSDDVNKSKDCNAIGLLQELTQKRRLPPPVYECSSEFGPAHSREYVFTVTLLNITEKGSGPSKKIAKKNAANAMIQHIEALGESLTSLDISGVVGNSSLLLDAGLIEAVQDLKLGVKKLDPLNPHASQKINQFYTALKSKTGKTLASLQGLSLNVPATNYCQMLEEIAEEQSFTTTYVNLNERTADENYQCLVQLSSLPVAVCHGVGRTIDEAQLVAAHNALQYLKIMTRKT